jgi:hypothetical protein
MRRATLRLLVGVIGATILWPARAGSQQLVVQRLLGTWRSDKERTVAHWQFEPAASIATREKLAAWFGRFTYTFTPVRVTANFDGGTWAASYRITSATENALALEIRHPERSESLSLYFDGPYFLIRSGRGGNFEYFKRAET